MQLIAMSSWKTTVFGILLVVDAVGHVISALIDNDLTTNPDWSLVLVAVVTAAGLIFAKDRDK